MQLSLDDFPVVQALVSRLDNYLQRRYSDFFGTKAFHPVLPLKRWKVIHDNLWGTNRYTWRELLLIDSPLMQRLRDIHQVGLAFQVYPSAHHTRFEHSLGVMTIASRVFEALEMKNRGELENLAQVVFPEEKNPPKTIARLKQELRLAALLHDTGHSLFSHTSELAYEKIDLLQKASRELKGITGKLNGAGEVMSFCLCNTPSVKQLLSFKPDNLIGETLTDDYAGEVNLTNISLMIVGRSTHPYLQFMGDIISSDFDADKLDYLLRDARAAGLPLVYDLDRYLHAVRIERTRTADGEGQLENLYKTCSATTPEKKSPGSGIGFPFYETYRLRLPKQATNALEQIVICKMMLFSYLYHHKKVRAAEGLLERALRIVMKSQKSSGKTDEELIEWFLTTTDSALMGEDFLFSGDLAVRNYAYRIANRLLPRVVFSMCGSDATHAERALLTEFLTDLQDKRKRPQKIADLEREIGEQLLALKPEMGTSVEQVLHVSGTWVDVPKAPQFEGIDELVAGTSSNSDSPPFTQIFPIRQWTQAYTHYRYYVRVFSFSEHWSAVETAAKTAMQKLIGIKGDTFYKQVLQNRR